MDSNIIYKNIGETFKCNFEIDGASVDDIGVRLCLEFSDNKNLFFYGTVDESGDCTIHIPRLPEIEDKSGKMVVEAIVDSTYFRLYESSVDLRNSVNVRVKQMEGTFFKNEEPKKDARIQLSGMRRETPKRNQVVVEKEIDTSGQSGQNGFTEEFSNNPYVSRKAFDEAQEKKTEKKSGLSSFHEWSLKKDQE